MPITIAEYLGVNAAAAAPVPHPKGMGAPNCPFNGLSCTKVSKNKKPVCSVWAGSDLWITCQHRLLSDSKNAAITHPHMSVKASEIATRLWQFPFSLSQVAVARKKNIRDSQADFVFALNPGWRVVNAPLRFVLEIQAGGDTTDSYQQAVAEWENGSRPLTDVIPKCSPNDRNVWKRLMEQLLTKGLAATKARQGIGCVISDRLFNAVDDWIRWRALTLPEDGYADFVVIPFTVHDASTSPIALVPNDERIIRTSFTAFFDHLRRSSQAADFTGAYIQLDGNATEGL